MASVLYGTVPWLDTGLSLSLHMVWAWSVPRTGTGRSPALHYECIHLQVENAGTEVKKPHPPQWGGGRIPIPVPPSTAALNFMTL